MFACKSEEVFLYVYMYATLALNITHTCTSCDMAEYVMTFLNYMQDNCGQQSKTNAFRRQLTRLHQARSERTARRLADQAALAIANRDVAARALIHSERLRSTTVDENMKLKRENKVSETQLYFDDPSRSGGSDVVVRLLTTCAYTETCIIVFSDR